MRSPVLTITLFAIILLAAASGPAIAASILLSEVLPDPAGRDDGGVFIELRGTPGTRLDGWRLVARNGRGGAVTHEVDLTGAVFGDSGFFVVADGIAGVTSVPFADLVVDDLDLQNGPDSITLLRGDDVVDALAYGSFSGDLMSFGEGTAAPQPKSGWSLARRWADVDTDDNERDFELLASPTPGRGRSLPEPGTWILLAAGAASLALAAVFRR